MAGCTTVVGFGGGLSCRFAGFFLVDDASMLVRLKKIGVRPRNDGDLQRGRMGVRRSLISTLRQGAIEKAETQLLGILMLS